MNCKSLCYYVILYISNGNNILDIKTYQTLKDLRKRIPIRSVSLLIGLYSGVYLAQNYQIPKVLSPFEILRMLKKVEEDAKDVYEKEKKSFKSTHNNHVDPEESDEERLVTSFHI